MACMEYAKMDGEGPELGVDHETHESHLSIRKIRGDSWCSLLDWCSISLFSVNSAVNRMGDGTVRFATPLHLPRASTDPPPSIACTHGSFF